MDSVLSPRERERERESEEEEQIGGINPQFHIPCSLNKSSQQVLKMPFP